MLKVFRDPDTTHQIRKPRKTRVLPRRQGHNLRPCWAFSFDESRRERGEGVIELAFKLHEWVWDVSAPRWRLLLVMPVLILTLPFMLLGALRDVVEDVLRGFPHAK